MKKSRNSLCLALCLCLAATVTMSQRKVETTAEKVMLFIDGAQVKRTQQVDIPAGTSTLLFTGLSPYLDARSMQVSAKGKLTITAVNLQYNYPDSITLCRRQEDLQKALQHIKMQEEEYNAALGVVIAEKEMLKGNCTLNGKINAQSLATIREITVYFAEQLKSLSDRELSIRKSMKELSDEYQRLADDLRKAQGEEMKRTGEILVGIHAPVACTATFTLSYYVKNAGWFPSYDIRSGNLTEPLILAYKANIFQHTGEDWKNVTLSLCSSSPSTGNVAPRLLPYRLNYGLAAPSYHPERNGNVVTGIVTDAENNEPLIGATVRIPGSTLGCATDMNGRYTLVLPNGQNQLEFAYIGYDTQTAEVRNHTLNIRLYPDMRALEEVVVTGYSSKMLRRPVAAVNSLHSKEYAETEDEAEAEESMAIEVEQTRPPTGYEFAIKMPYTILSNNKPIVAEIGRYELPATYIYQCTPKIDKDAFLTAQITDWNKLNLLEGEANIYFEDTFIGKTIVDPGRSGDTLSFSLGRDRQIAVERLKENEYTSRKLIGSAQTQSIGWKLSVRNTRLQTVTLMLYDQLPVSANSTITVTAEELSGGQINEDTGIITWSLKLEPGEHRNLSLRYKVKYPKDKRLPIE